MLPLCVADCLLIHFVSITTYIDAAFDSTKITKENHKAPVDFAGYKFDEHDRNSSNLRLQFARFTGPRGNSGPGGPRGRR